MKRSEAVKAIHDALYEITGTSWGDERCSEILTALEKLGMIPRPDSIEYITDFLIYAYFRKGQDVQETFWEPEDEKVTK